MTSTVESTIIPDGKMRAIIVAGVQERLHGDRWYATVSHDGVWRVTNKMPLFGEWYDSSGHRHG